MADIASFWVGARLGAIELASARSFLRQGDRLSIYSYAPIENLPPGVLQRDAREVMPCDEIVRHRKTGSPALHSDMFRYALLAQTDQIWADLDIIALKPFDFPSAFVFAYEAVDHINGAVLKLPKSSESLRALQAFGPDYRGVPPRVSRSSKRVKLQILSWLRGGLTPAEWPWGAIGPAGLTHYLGKTGEIRHALPIEAFYAVPLERVADFLTPGALSLATLPPEAWGVHLWASKLRKHLREAHGDHVPEGSFLAEVLALE